MKRQNLDNATELNTRRWLHLTRISTTLALFATVLVSAGNTGTANQTATNAQPEFTKQAQGTTPSDPFAQTQIKPNFQLNVERQAGSCPKTVGLWLFSLGFEGGADHTVVPDMLGVAASPVKLVSSAKNRLEYEAPLRSNYASCVGKASSPLLSFYNYQFQNGKVSFRVDVSQGDGYREILYKGVSGYRPYILWRAAE